MNVAMTDAGGFVEVQGTAEREPFDRAQLDALLALAEGGIRAALRGAARRAGRASPRSRLTPAPRSSRRSARFTSPTARCGARRSASSARSPRATSTTARSRAYLAAVRRYFEPLRTRGAGPAAARRPRLERLNQRAVQPHRRARRRRQAHRGRARRPRRARGTRAPNEGRSTRSAAGRSAFFAYAGGVAELLARVAALHRPRCASAFARRSTRPTCSACSRGRS